MALAMPGMLQAMAWVILLSPRFGFINALFQNLLGFNAPIFNIYSLTGMIVVEGLRLVPTAFLMLVPLLRRMDPALEEAAAVSGARPASSIRKITLPLLTPGLLPVIIYQSMSALEGFEIPGILGFPAGIFVFSTRIYFSVHSTTFPPPYGEASALAILYVGIALIATYFYLRIINRGEKYAVVTGKGYRPRLVDLGVWRLPAFFVVILFISVAILIPLMTLFYVSLVPYLQAPSWDVFKVMTFKHYLLLPDYPDLYPTLINTFLMVTVTASCTTLLSFLVSFTVVRSGFGARKFLDQLVFLPHAIPGIVIALAFLWALLQVEFVPIFGTIWAISLAFIVQFLAYGTRSINASILQIHKELEEAAYVSGARPYRTMLRIFVPLILPSLAGVWIWAVLVSVRAAGTPLMLSHGTINQVLAALIWHMWDFGEIGRAAALGATLILTLLIIVALIRVRVFRPFSL
jgi:iron(III) transport system permease protein